MEVEKGKLNKQEARSVRQLVERSGLPEDYCIQRVLNRRFKLIEVTYTTHDDGTTSNTKVEREFTSVRSRKKAEREFGGESSYSFTKSRYRI